MMTNYNIINKVIPWLIVSTARQLKNRLEQTINLLLYLQVIFNVKRILKCPHVPTAVVSKQILHYLQPDLLQFQLQ